MNEDQNNFEEFDRNENTKVSSNLLSVALGRALADEIVTNDNIEENTSECITFQGTNGEFHTISLSSEEAMALGIKFVNVNTVVPSMSNQMINQDVEYNNYIRPESQKSVEVNEAPLELRSIEESEIISYQVQKLNPVSLLFNSIKNETDSNEQPINNNLPVMIEGINSLNQVQKVTNNIPRIQVKQQAGTLLNQSLNNKQKSYFITQPNKKIKLDMLNPAVNKKILSNIQPAPQKRFSYVNINNNNNIANKPRTILPKQMMKVDNTLSNTSQVPLKKQSRVKSLLGANILDNLKPIEIQTGMGNKDFIKIKNSNSIKVQNIPRTAASSLLLKDKVHIFPVKIRNTVQNNNNQTNIASKLIYSVNSLDSSKRVIEGPKNIIAKAPNTYKTEIAEDDGRNIVFNVDRNIVANKSENSTKFDNGVVEKKLYKMPVKNDKMPLGSTDNPFKLIQNGQNFHSVQALNDHQLQQLAGILKQRPSHQPTDGSREQHKVMLYDTATNKKIVYRVVYPEELDLKEDPKAGVESDLKSTRSRGRPKGKSKCPSPVPVEVKSSRPPARTRCGRVSRPPPRMVQDYKRLRPNDSDREDSPDNLDIIHSADNTPDYQPHIPVNTSSLQEKTFDDAGLLLQGLQKKERNIKSQYICPTCKKIYLGYTRMKRHLEVHPEHGEIEKLGLEPKEPVQKQLKKPFQTRGRGRHFLKQNTQSLEGNINQDKPNIIENTESANINNPDLLSTFNLTEAKAKQSICDMTTDVNKHSEYISNILSYNKFSMFDLLMKKVNCVGAGNKMNTLCMELIDLIEKVKNVTNQSLLLTNSKAENVTHCEIPEEISRFLGISAGHYDIDEEVFNSNIQETSVNASFESGLGTHRPNSENLISTTFESSTPDTPRLDNHTLENMDIDMTCVSNSEEFINKNIPINILVADHTITPIHTTVNHLLGSSEQNQLQLEQPILQHTCSQIDAAMSLEHNSLNILRSDISIHEDEYQNVDELVSERLQNLTADELAVPPLNVSRSTLDAATSSQQLTCPDLPLDFLFNNS